MSCSPVEEGTLRGIICSWLCVLYLDPNKDFAFAQNFGLSIQAIAWSRSCQVVS